MAELSMNGRERRARGVVDRRQGQPVPLVDGPLALAALALAALGLVMVASASVGLADRQFGDPLHYFWRQGAYLILGLALAAVVLRTPIDQVQRLAPWAMVGGILLLALVLVPGIGHEVNGSTRWLSLGLFNFQPAEVAKLALILYLADYAVRRRERLEERWGGLLVPLGVTALHSVLLLAQPDFGSTVLVTVCALVILFLGGAPLGRFLVIGIVGMGALAAMAVLSPYRLARLTSFVDPWADPFDEGFQLTQALIALGRGEWWGTGLGSSVQKLFYLPEAHTDFVLAVIGEELGLVGVLLVLTLFTVIAWRSLIVAHRAEAAGRPFAALLVCGLGTLLALQAFVNMGVNLGLLPTKGITLPFISYGGSSLVASCAAVALILRVDLELRYPYRFAGQERRGGP